MRTRALVALSASSGPGIEEIEVAPPGPGEVLVKLAASGVCGSDGHAVHGRSPAVRYPCVLGHEGAGVITEVGSGVSGLKEGDHVILALYVPCGECRQCLHGHFAHCSGEARKRGTLGIRSDGATRARLGDQELYPFMGLGTLAESTNVPAAQVVKIEPTLPSDEICLIGCGVTTGFGAAVNTAGVRPGDSVVVVGCGGVGLNVVQGARIAGATTIIAVDTAAVKRSLAQGLGATHVIDPAAGTMLDQVLAIVDGGVDLAFEVVGNPELVARTLELVRIGGKCVMVGAPPPKSVIPVTREALMMERGLLGCRGGSNVPNRDIPRLVALYESGQLHLSELVGKRLAFEDYAAAFESLEIGDVARSVVVFDA